jgi:4-hydroxybenzoate polyprenyltransferase
VRRSGTLLALVRACHPDACVAVALVAVLLGVAAGRGTGGLVLVGTAVFTGQLCIGWYNDYLDAARDAEAGRTDKPVAAGAVRPGIVLIAAVLAGVACVPLSLSVGLLPGVLHLVAVVSALAYDVWLKATAVSVLPYLLSFGLLPLFVVLGLPGAHAPWWLPLAGALLGAGAHFANVLPDLAEDRASGVLGLPHRLGATGSRWAAVVLLLGASGVLALGPSGHALPRALLAVASVLVLAAGLVIGRRPGSRLAFRAVLVVALLDVCQLVLAGASLR